MIWGGGGEEKKFSRPLYARMLWKGMVIFMLVDQVLTGILQRLPGQTFSIRKVCALWTPEERERFEQELEYFSEKYTLETLVDGYLFLTETTLKESRYFQENGDYRYHSFEEVNQNVYSNTRNMTLCMLGLSLAEYLWETVLRTHRFFEAEIRKVCGNRYLEIGPGHGKYFYEAYALGQFKEYTAVDISPTAITMTEDYMKHRKAIWGGHYKLVCQDATQMDVGEKYDFIVIQEVLEHLENPLAMLIKIGELLETGGSAYVHMPICAPSAQHIFLFRNISHVRDMVEKAGFEILKEEYVTANHISAEAAEKKKLPINACLIVRKK